MLLKSPTNFSRNSNKTNQNNLIDINLDIKDNKKELGKNKIIHKNKFNNIFDISPLKVFNNKCKNVKIGLE